MDSITNKTLWKLVAPLVFFWMIPAEIEKLKNFLSLFSELTCRQSRWFIWQITRSEEPFWLNFLTKISENSLPINSLKIQII